MHDCANELVQETVTNFWQTQFTYDGFGRRRSRQDYVWQMNQNQWTLTNSVYYIYDGMTVLQERDGNNNPLVSYTRGTDLSGTSQGAGGIGGLLARTDTNGSSFYHTDGNGNVTMLVNGTGTVLAKYLYDSYGNTVGSWGSLANANTYRFSSKEVDLKSGLYYYGYRYYQPNLQRWLNRDPIEEAGGINLYGHVGNDPVNCIDLFGLEGNPISSTLPRISGAWDSDPAGGGGSFYGPGFYQSLAIQQASAQAAAQQAAIDAYNASVPSDFWLNANGQAAMGGIDDLSVDYTSAYLAASSGLGRLSTCKNAADSGLSGTALARQLGQAGEDAVGITGPKVGITIPGTDTIRFPDQLTSTTLTEVKNVQNLSFTQQLQDYSTYAQQNGLQFNLYVRPTTTLSGPLQNAINSGLINKLYIRKP
jgi:RHS repeat-associated protein